MTTQPTPGPTWKIGRTLWLQGDIVHEAYPDNDKGAQIIIEVTDGAEQESIAWAFAENQRDEYTHARLIAAAPRMLEALQDLSDILAEYIKYGQEMRKHGRGFSTVDTAGRVDVNVLAGARALLREIHGGQ